LAVTGKVEWVAKKGAQGCEPSSGKNQSMKIFQVNRTLGHAGPKKISLA
jgi:hypothetical protein